MHTENLSLRDVDASALDYARRLQAGLNGFRLDEGGAGGEGGEGGEGGAGEDGGTGGEGGSGGEGGTPDLTQQALDAIEALKTTGTQIPEALTAAVNELKSARSEAANYRTQLREVETKTGQHDEVLKGIAKALGLDGGNGDGDPDPQELQRALNEKDAALKTQTIELAAIKAAPKHQADPTALLDSRSFIEAAAKLDPTTDDFASELDSLVKKTVEDNPKLKVGQASTKGGGDFTGGTGDEKAPKTLEDAVAARYGS